MKVWATDLLSPVQEYIGFYIARYVSSKRLRGLTVRPFQRAEYELLYETLKRERDAHAGGSSSPEGAIAARELERGAGAGETGNRESDPT